MNGRQYTEALRDLTAALIDFGYQARVEGLGGNIVGIAVTTATGRQWVLTIDESDELWDGGSWLIGRDGPDDDLGVAASASLGNDTATVAGWADQMMGCDR